MGKGGLVPFPIPARARLLAYRSRWHGEAGREAEARSDLLAAARLADRDEIPWPIPAQLSLARRQFAPPWLR